MSTLKDGDWEEVSTGHVTIQLLDAITLLVIRSEIDGSQSLLILDFSSRHTTPGSIIREANLTSRAQTFNHEVCPTAKYERDVDTSQDSLIYWTESDGSQFCMSFQIEAGCQEIWAKIAEVQVLIANSESQQGGMETSQDSRREEQPLSITLPAFESK